MHRATWRKKTTERKGKEREGRRKLNRRKRGSKGGCWTTLVVVGGLEGYFKRGARPLMERFLGLRTKQADGRSGSGAENRAARTRCEMTTDLPCS